MLCSETRTVHRPVHIMYSGATQHHPDPWCRTVEVVYCVRLLVRCAANKEHYDVLWPAMRETNIMEPVCCYRVDA